MISERLVSQICEDVGEIYRMTCDENSQAVMTSSLFQQTAEKIRTEEPLLSNEEILSLMLQVYSNIIKRQ